MRQRTEHRRPREFTRWGLGFTLLVVLAAGSSAAAGGAGDATDRLAPPRPEPLTQYRAFRRMHARSENFGQEGWLEAWTELDARGFRFQIVSERGSDAIRSRVLKAVLKREQDLVEHGDPGSAALTLDNYDFQDATQGDGEQYVQMKPKRKDVLLLDGRMVLSQDGSELLRVEGRLTRNPSFWTSLVNVVRHYARLDGVRVPIATESVAKVKFAGTSHFDVRYEYETINGRPVSLAARRTASSLSASR